MLFHILSTDSDWIQTICRIILGVIFFAHGARKLFGWFAGPGLKRTIAAMKEFLGFPAVLTFGVVIVEFFGGLALVVGLLSRIAALGISITMLFAILMVHGRYGLFLNWFGDRKGHGYEYHVLVIGLAIVIIARGSGALSLDRVFWLPTGA
jgi:putative oxidoreductase